jgi:hypothetical protein
MTSSPQLNFDDAPRLRKHFASAEEQFQAFHRDNPQVYRQIVHYARKLRRKGFKHYSIKTIWAVMRWHYDTGTDGYEDHFKLNDRHYSRYARMIMKYEPDLENFFNLRRLRS